MRVLTISRLQRLPPSCPAYLRHNLVTPNMNWTRPGHRGDFQSSRRHSLDAFSARSISPAVKYSRERLSLFEVRRER